MKRKFIRMFSLLCLFVVMSLGMAVSASAVTENDCVSWMNANLNKVLDFDGNYGGQCVDTFNYYLRDVWGISNPIKMYPVDYAYQIFDYNAPAGWTKIAGSGNYRVGDVVIWSAGNGSTTGHVGIVYSVNGSTVKIFQQRYGGKDYCTIQNIHWPNLIRGVFRPPIETETYSYASISLDKYFIRNNGTGTYLAVSNSGTGDNILAWERNGYTYEFEMEILSADTGYRIRPTCSTNVVNVYADTVASGKNVNLYRDGNNSTQWWGFQPANGGYVIRNMQNQSVCLSIDSSGSNVCVSTYTGAANQIWSLEPSTIAVTGVSLDKTSATLLEGASTTLTATVSPSNATNKSITWSSSNSSVASVDGNGNVQALKPGTATITVKTADGSRTASCTVTVTAVTVIATGTSFSDVPDNAWCAKAVAWAAQNGITQGTTATTFSPNEACTRAQIVTFLWRAAGSPEPSTNKNPFKDVKDGPYYKAILWAVEKGITQGTTTTTFEPNVACTRAQAVTFLWRAAGKPTPKSTTMPFTDVPSKYYYNAVLWAVENNITQGTTGKTFSPNDTCTRAQIVTFLWRAMI